MAKKTKSAFALRAEYVPFLLFYDLCRILPLRSAYRLSGFIALVFWIFCWKYRKRAIEHVLFAGVRRTRPEAREIARESFRQFGMLLVEIVKTDQIFDPNKISFTGNQEALRDYFLPETRIMPNHLVLTAHYGNWEIAARIYTHFTKTKLTSIMRPFDNDFIGAKILAQRCFDLHETFPKNLGIRPVLKALKEGGNFTILADQHANHTEGVETTFFGHPCRTHMTLALLSLKTGLPIVPHITRRLPGENARFEVRFGKPIIYQPTGNKAADVRAICQLCNDSLEEMIRLHPEQWMWSHRRWLDADGRSPRDPKTVSEKIL